jgi:hypothetical protein
MSTPSNPIRHCDMVMKGGITSGVIYPLTAVQLSKDYVFKNLGGTSAGAIAAAAVAAAEHGRAGAHGSGFDGLARLPEWLGSNLLSLFQPSQATKPLFSILTAGIRRSGLGRRAMAILGAAVRGFPLAVAVGLLLGLILGIAAVVGAHGFLLIWGLLIFADLGEGVGQDRVHGYQTLTSSRPRPRC